VCRVVRFLGYNFRHFANRLLLVSSVFRLFATMVVGNCCWLVISVGGDFSSRRLSSMSCKSERIADFILRQNGGNFTLSYVRYSASLVERFLYFGPLAKIRGNKHPPLGFTSFTRGGALDKYLNHRHRSRENVSLGSSAVCIQKIDT